VTGVNRLAAALYLHKDLVGGVLGTQHDGHSCHAFAAHHANLSLPAMAIAGGHDRSESALDEEDGCDAPVRMLQPMPKWQRPTADRVAATRNRLLTEHSRWRWVASCDQTDWDP